MPALTPQALFTVNLIAAAIAILWQSIHFHSLRRLGNMSFHKRMMAIVTVNTAR